MAEARLVLPEGTKVPNHIALVLDGNRRWARARGLPTFEGHRSGFEAGMKVAQAARDFGVHTFTVWGFSTENWDRSEDEINYLTFLFGKMLDEVKKRADKEGIRFVHLGRKDRLPAELVKYIRQVEEETRWNDKYIFNAALDYGGHDEIVRAVRKMMQSGVAVENVDEKTLEKFLDTGDQPYPNVDLFIRTSGEQRTSGLLPWQMHYAEYFWEIDHLPDMTGEKLRDIIVDYSRRRRRFGGNDKEEHLKFDPKVSARLEVQFHRALHLGENERLRDLVMEYVRQQYGLSKELAKEAGLFMWKALISRKQGDFVAAKTALQSLYEIVRRNLGLALDPGIVANLQIGLWQKGNNEQELKQMYAETYRVSDFQASKSAHLAYMANAEIEKSDFKKAATYLEKFYKALKERVA